MIALLIVLYALGALATAGFLLFGTDFSAALTAGRIRPHQLVVVSGGVIVWPATILAFFLLLAVGAALSRLARTTGP
jgi:hypothetical protein